jgi:hypothetical protein
LPLEGYSSAEESKNEQDRAIRKLNEEMADLVEEWAAQNDDYRVMLTYSGKSNIELKKALAFDASFAGFSIVFVLLTMVWHTGSVATAGLGMLQIIVGFPATFFIYNLVLGNPHFSTLQVLALYVILGIGADDNFVLSDAFQ